MRARERGEGGGIYACFACLSRVRVCMNVPCLAPLQVEAYAMHRGGVCGGEGQGKTQKAKDRWA